MSQNNKTHYEVLGVPRDAKVTDIVRAYKRIRANQDKETAAPDARLLAVAKAAYDTLSDPDRRDEYDRSLAGDSSASRPRSGV
ncbi:MAG TPA: DnaJ domain-containing protein, partial [Usitatibacter sp.]